MTSKLHNSKRGFTLVELLVYIALLSVIALLAGSVLVDSIRFKRTTESKMAAFANANEAMTYLEADLSRMGAKAWLMNSQMSNTRRSVYWDTTANDLSSFTLTDNGTLDQITFRAGIYNSHDSLNEVREIHWWISGTDLFRQERVVGGSLDPAVLMVSGVTAFNVDPGLQLVDTATLANRTQWTAADSLNLITSSSLDISTTGSGMEITNFSASTDQEVQLAYPSSTTPRTLAFEPGVTYGVRMTVNPTTELGQDFNYNSDQFLVGFRTMTGSNNLPGVQDYVMYPGKSTGSRERVFYFSHAATTTQYGMLIFKFNFGPLVTDDSLKVDSIKIWKARLATYDWHTPVLTIPEKIRTKAMRIDLRINKNGEESHLNRIIPTPNNGV